MSERFAQPINASTGTCAVYGFPIRHSASPAMQNAGMAALGLNWRYLAFEVQPEKLRSAIEGARAMNFIGLNLTVPHKLLALDMVDELDESARLWGAVNTIRFDQGRSFGFNTDGDAITRALREDLGFESKSAKVLVLGAGGAGRTAALKLASDGVAQIFLVNRTAAKATSIASEIRERYPQVEVVVDYPSGSIELVLNATSAGLKANDPVPLDQGRFSLRRAGSFYDMIYRPAETPLLKLARAAGCKAANGLGMLLHQGAKALEVWSQRPAPLDVMRKALEKEVYG